MEQERNSHWPLSRILRWALIIAPLIVVLIFVGYQMSWTGFGSTITKETTRTTEAGGTEVTTETQHEKKLWEWLGLAGVLAVPVILSIGGIWYNHRQNQREEERIEAERQREEMAANERAQDAALQAYLDQMSNLMIEQSLRSKPKESDVPLLATARTTAILLMLDKNRKRRPLKLVYRLRLINKDNPLVNLENADLEQANLSETKLSEAYLKGVDLRRANLRGSNLAEADLTEADLRGADLSGTSLKDACLEKANLLPYDKVNPAKLSRHRLDGAASSSLDLSDKELVPTNLSNTNLEDANLSGAILANSDLRNTRGLTEEQLEQAIGDQRTLLPSGFESPAAWEKPIEEQIKMRDKQKEVV